MMQGEIARVRLPDGTPVLSLGQGTWFMGNDPSTRKQEVAALQCGIDLGMTLIDTAEMYGDGAAELLVGKAIANRRSDVFLVSKVLPHHADRRGTQAACEASLRRLKTDCLDLYLLHWPGSIPLEETVIAMERLLAQGKILRWGVSNFDTADLAELYELIEPGRLATNQVLYNLSRRGIEFDLLPYSREKSLPIMAYSPIEQGRILHHPALRQIADELRATPAQVALAWVLRQPGIIAIPKAARCEHVESNFNALTLQMSDEHLQILAHAFPAPQRKTPLEML